MNQLPPKKLIEALVDSEFNFISFNEADDDSFGVDKECFMPIESNTDFGVTYSVSGIKQVDRGHHISVPRNCNSCRSGRRGNERCPFCANGVIYVEEWVSNYVNEPWSKRHSINYNFKTYFMHKNDEYADYHLQAQRKVFDSCSKPLEKHLELGSLNDKIANKIKKRCEGDFDNYYNEYKDWRISSFLEKNSYIDANLDKIKFDYKKQIIKVCFISQVTIAFDDKSITVCQSDGKFFVTDSTNLSYTSTANKVLIIRVVIFLLACFYSYTQWGKITSEDFSFYGPLATGWLDIIKDTIIEWTPNFLIELIWASIITITSTLLIGAIFAPIVKKLSTTRKNEIKSAEIFAKSLAKHFD